MTGMGFITDFYLNCLDPQQRATPPDSEIMRRSKELSDNEAALLEMLPEEEKRLFRQIRDERQFILTDNSLDRFVMGFRYGAKFACDTFTTR